MTDMAVTAAMEATMEAANQKVNPLLVALHAIAERLDKAFDHSPEEAVAELRMACVTLDGIQRTIDDARGILGRALDD